MACNMIEGYHQSPYTTPELQEAGQELLRNVAIARHGQGFKLNIDLATKIWNHIQHPPITAATEQLQQQPGHASTSSTSAATVTVPLQVPTHLPAALNPHWQSSDTPNSDQIYYRPPSSSSTVRVDDNTLLSRDFESAQPRAPIKAEENRCLVIRAHRKPPEGWKIWLFMGCLRQPPQQEPQRQPPQQEPQLQQQQQQEEEHDEAEAMLVDAWPPVSPCRALLGDNEYEFARRFHERTGSHPEPWYDTAAATTAAAAVAVAHTSAAAVGGNSGVPVQPAALDNSATSNSSSSSPVLLTVPNVNPTHSFEQLTANKYKDQLVGEVSVGWLVMLREPAQQTANQPAQAPETDRAAAPTAATAAAAAATTTTAAAATAVAAAAIQRKRRATVPESDVAEPATTGSAMPAVQQLAVESSSAAASAAAAAAAAASTAAVAELVKEARSLTLSMSSSAPKDSVRWDTARQLQLFDPERVWDAQPESASGVPGQLEVPTAAADIQQLQDDIQHEHDARRGKNSKGENVLHLLAKTRRASMDTRMQLLDIILGVPHLLESLSEDLSADGSTALMMAALGDPRPLHPIGYRCLPWRSDIYYILLQRVSRRVLIAMNKRGWTVLHRLLHSADVYEQHGDAETQQLLLKAYADTLYRMLMAAIEHIAACPAAVAATLQQQQQQQNRQQPSAIGSMPVVGISHEQFQSALEWVLAVKNCREPPAEASSKRYRGRSQRAAADDVFAQQYPQYQWLLGR